MEVGVNHPRLTVAFGAMAPPLAEQLETGGLGPLRFDPNKLQLAQRFADAITLTKVHGILSEAEAKRARLRLVRWLGRAMKGGE